MAGARRSVIVVVGLAVVLALLTQLSGCSSTSKAGEVTPVREGYLTVATALPAPGFWNGTDVDHLRGGFEYRLAAAMADRLHLQLRVLDVPFERLAAGDLGGADLAMTQLSATDKRLELLSLSRPYYGAEAGLLVRPGTAVPDLAAARVLRWVVERSTTQEDLLASTIRPTAPAKVLQSIEQLADDVRAGGSDVALLDLPTALVLAHGSDGALAVAAQIETGEQLVIGLPKGSANLSAINAALGSLETDGTTKRLAEEELTPAMGRAPKDVPILVARPPS